MASTWDKTLNFRKGEAKIYIKVNPRKLMSVFKN
jgi:hypothetical protein